MHNRFFETGPTKPDSWGDTAADDRLAPLGLDVELLPPAPLDRATAPGLSASGSSAQGDGSGLSADPALLDFLARLEESLERTPATFGGAVLAHLEESLERTPATFGRSASGGRPREERRDAPATEPEPAPARTSAGEPELPSSDEPAPVPVGPSAPPQPPAPPAAAILSEPPQARRAVQLPDSDARGTIPLPPVDGSAGRAVPPRNETPRPVPSPQAPRVSVPVPPPSPAARPRPAATLTPTAPSVTLEEVVTRQTPVLWHEAVAVLQATCERLAPAEGPEHGAPDLPGIRIHADGTVSVDESAGAAGSESVIRLARVLHALLPSHATPAPLRLLVGKWTGVSGDHSIRSFAAEVSYFARPHGDALIRALYGRCTAARAPHAPVPADKPAAPAPEPAKTPPSSRRRRLLVPLGAAAVAATLSTAWFLGPPPAALLDSARSLSPNWAALASLAASPSPAAPETDTGESAAPATPAGSNPADVRLSRSPTPPAAGSSSQTGDSTALPTLPSAAATLAFLDAPIGADPADPTVAPPSTLTPAPVPATAFSAAPIRPGPNAIFSSADEEVEPPQLVYPQLPLPPERPGSDVAVNTMEVVVGPDGRVQTVHLVSRPQRMNDMMLLSAAKVWRFEPAYLDGEPVPYRMRISWATTP